MSQSSILLFCCAKDAHLWPICLRGIRRVFDGMVVLADDQDHPSGIDHANTVQWRINGPGGWTAGVVDAFSKAAARWPEITHWIKRDIDTLDIDGSWMQADDSVPGRGFSGRKWKAWYGSGYMLRRDLIPNLVRMNLEGRDEDVNICHAAMRLAPVEMMEGLFGANVPGITLERFLKAGAKLVHLGEFKYDHFRETAATEMERLLSELESLPHSDQNPKGLA